MLRAAYYRLSMPSMKFGNSACSIRAGPFALCQCFPGGIAGDWTGALFYVTQMSEWKRLQASPSTRESLGGYSVAGDNARCFDYSALSVVSLLLLSQCRHWQRNVVCLCAYADSSLAGIGWRGADVPGGRTLSRPEHVAQHARGCAGAIRRNCLHVASG